MSMMSVKRPFDPVIWKLNHTKKLYVLEYFSYQLLIFEAVVSLIPITNMAFVGIYTELMYNSFYIVRKTTCYN